jgi:hypothetical protein
MFILMIYPAKVELWVVSGAKAPEMYWKVPTYSLNERIDSGFSLRFLLAQAGHEMEIAWAQ